MKTEAVFIQALDREIMFHIGKSQKENFAVIDMGAEDDLWFHAKDESSCHVVCEIPNDIDWVLRVDGHSDATPVPFIKYSDNFELSNARALSVAKLLNDNTNLTTNRIAANGFGNSRPINENRINTFYKKQCFWIRSGKPGHHRHIPRVSITALPSSLRRSNWTNSR